MRFWSLMWLFALVLGACFATDEGSSGAGGSAGSPAASQGPPAECKLQCELASGKCAERSLGDYEGLEAARVDVAQCDGVLWAFEADCGADGPVVLRWGTGYTTEGRFYDRSSGAFLGLTTTTDVVGPPCLGKSFWPALVACEQPVVTEVLCGNTFDAGDAGGDGITQTSTALHAANNTGLPSSGRSIDVGEACLPQQVPDTGFDPREAYVETSSADCLTGVCLVYRYEGDPREGDPEQVAQSVYCSCRCNSGDTGFSECECQAGFSCVDVLEQGGPGVRGGYCVRNEP